MIEELDQFYNEDCLGPKGLSQISSNSVRAIIADFPYEMTNNTWDICIPLPEFWKEAWRILVSNGIILLYSKQPFTTTLINSQSKYFQYERIWVKEKGTDCFLAKQRPLPIHENILIFYRDTPLYHPQMNLGKPYTKIKKAHKQGPNYKKDAKAEILTISTGERYPTSVDYFPRDFANQGIHPTQKPVCYLETLIKTYSNPGELIIDPTAGSASTLIAAISTKRHYLGWELDKQYFEKAVNRIAEFKRTRKDEKPKVIPPLTPKQHTLPIIPKKTVEVI